jgi:hypothetical protein
LLKRRGLLLLLRSALPQSLLHPPLSMRKSRQRKLETLAKVMSSLPSKV